MLYMLFAWSGLKLVGLVGGFGHLGSHRQRDAGSETDNHALFV